jgi:hypothetical protein
VIGVPSALVIASGILTYRRNRRLQSKLDNLQPNHSLGTLRERNPPRDLLPSELKAGMILTLKDSHNNSQVAKILSITDNEMVAELGISDTDTVAFIRQDEKLYDAEGLTIKAWGKPKKKDEGNEL